MNDKLNALEDRLLLLEWQRVKAEAMRTRPLPKPTIIKSAAATVKSADTSIRARRTASGWEYRHGGKLLPENRALWAPDIRADVEKIEKLYLSRERGGILHSCACNGTVEIKD